MDNCKDTSYRVTYICLMLYEFQMNLPHNHFTHPDTTVDVPFECWLKYYFQNHFTCATQKSFKAFLFPGTYALVLFFYLPLFSD